MVICNSYHGLAWAVILLLALSSCKEREDGKESSRAYGTVVLKPVRRTWSVQYPAVLKGRQSVEIRPQCSGLITRICIEEGAAVRKGQPLFVIEQAPYLAALETASANVRQAEAQLATARLALSSKETLFGKNIISDYEVQMARNELKVAEAALAQAKAQRSKAQTELGYTVVRSPVNGMAGMIPYRIGTLVDRNISEPLVCVSDTEEMFAYFSVPESDALAREARGGTRRVTFRPQGEAGRSISGVVDAVSGMVDGRTGTISIRARMANRDGALYDGGNGTVVVSQGMDNCLVVPQTATYEIQGSTFVYKVVDGKAVSVRVEVRDIGSGKEFLVVGGLAAGDEIVSEGAGLLREGTEILRREDKPKK